MASTRSGHELPPRPKGTTRFDYLLGSTLSSSLGPARSSVVSEAKTSRSSSNGALIGDRALATRHPTLRCPQFQETALSSTHWDQENRHDAPRGSRVPSISSQNSIWDYRMAKISSRNSTNRLSRPPSQPPPVTSALSPRSSLQSTPGRSVPRLKEAQRLGRDAAMKDLFSPRAVAPPSIARGFRDRLQRVVPRSASEPSEPPSRTQPSSRHTKSHSTRSSFIDEVRSPPPAETGKSESSSSNVCVSSGQLLMRRLIADLVVNLNEGPSFIQSLDEEKTASSFDCLISFAHRHLDQVALWVEAFTHWDSFINSIVNTLSSTHSLRPEDGAQVLDVLPSPVLLYVYRRKYKFQLFPPLPLEARQLCMTPHVPQMGLTLVSVLAASNEFVRTINLIQLVTTAIKQLGASRVLVDLFKNIRVYTNSFPTEGNPFIQATGKQKSQQGSARLSLYTLIKIAHDTISIERFLQNCIFANSSDTATTIYHKRPFGAEAPLLLECRGALDDEVEAVVTKTSLFLGGIGSCLSMHLTNLQVLEDSLDMEISRLKDLEDSPGNDMLFRNFDVKAPPFSAVPQLKFISDLVQKLNSEYTLMQKQIKETVGRVLGITECTPYSQGPPPPLSMLVEGLSAFILKVDESVQQLLLSLNISQSDVTQRALSQNSRVCLPIIADIFAMCDEPHPSNNSVQPNR